MTPFGTGEGDLLLSLVIGPVRAAGLTEKRALFGAPGSLDHLVAKPAPPPSWFGRNTPLVLGGTVLAAGLGGGLLARYRNQQDKKKKRDAELAAAGGGEKTAADVERVDVESRGAKLAMIKVANPPAEVPPIGWNPSTWRLDERAGKFMNDAGKQFGAGVNQSGANNPFGGVTRYVENNPWASAALLGAPIGAGIGLLGGLSNRKKKRNALGDMLTGGFLGAGAGALGGGAWQLYNSSSQKPPPPPDNSVPSTPGVNDAKSFGGKDPTPFDKIRSTVLDNEPQRDARIEARNQANESIFGPAIEGTRPDTAAGKAVRTAAGDRAVAEAGAATAEQETALGRLLSGKSKATASANLAETNQNLGLAARKITPNDLTQILGDPSPDGKRTDITPGVDALFGGAGRSAENVRRFDKLNDVLKAKGYSGYRWGGGPQPENPIADPKAHEEFINSLDPTNTTGNGHLGAFGRTALTGAAATRAGIELANRGARVYTGGDQNRVEAARNAAGLLKHRTENLADLEPSIRTARLAAAEGAKPKSLLGKIMPWNLPVSGAVDNIGQLVGLATKPVSPTTFTTNQGNMAQLAAIRGMGQAGPPLSAAELAKEITSGNLSTETQRALKEMAAGRAGNKEFGRTIVGNRDIDLRSLALDPKQMAAITDKDGPFGPTKVTKTLDVKRPILKAVDPPIIPAPAAAPVAFAPRPDAVTPKGTIPVSRGPLYAPSGAESVTSTPQAVRPTGVDQRSFIRKQLTSPANYGSLAAGGIMAAVDRALDTNKTYLSALERAGVPGPLDLSKGPEAVGDLLDRLKDRIRNGPVTPDPRMTPIPGANTNIPISKLPGAVENSIGNAIENVKNDLRVNPVPTKTLSKFLEELRFRRKPGEQDGNK